MTYDSSKIKNPASITLENLLLRDQSRANTDFLIEILTNKPGLFDEFWEIMLENREPVSRRAAWVVDYYCELHPLPLSSRIEELASGLNGFSSDGLKRHAMRMLSRSELPVENLGVLTDISFKWLQSKTETVAVKAYCMIILEKVSEKYPEFITELSDIIEYQMDEATPGFKNLAKKVLFRLKKKNRS